MAYTFLTGTTGLLGRYLIRDLTVAGVPVAVLVRPTRKASAQHRIESVMCFWDNQLGRSLPRPVVLEGDISEPDLGLDARGMRWVAENCDAVLHNAASLSFQATGPTSEPFRSNVEGLRHVLELCRNARIRRFFQVSTAYVCGLRQGRVLESDLDVGQTMSNDYEQSKLQAEKLVRGADFLDEPTVFRPAIIIGDSKDSFTTTFHGFYAPLQATHTIIRTFERNATGLAMSSARFPLSQADTMNLVPVDWVSAVMSFVVANPEHHGKTYHLTPRHPITSRLLADVLEETVGFYGVRLVGGDRELTGLTEIEQLFCELISVYSTYWKDDPAFDTTNTRTAAPHLPCPHVDRTMLRRLANYAISINFNAPRARAIEPHFDVARAIEPLLDPAFQPAPGNDTALRVGLRVTGHGGGDWTVWLSGNGVLGADVGLHAQCAANVHCEVELLADLAGGRLALDEIPPDQLEVTGAPVPPEWLARALLSLTLPNLTAQTFTAASAAEVAAR